MKTSVIEVHDMLSVLSVDEVEQRIGAVPGAESVTVNFAAGSATVRYDETRLAIADIKSAVRQRGYGSATPAAPPSDGGHQSHAAPGAPASAPAPAAPKSAPAAPAAPKTAASAGDGHEGHSAPAPGAPPASPGPSAEKKVMAAPSTAGTAPQDKDKAPPAKS